MNLSATIAKMRAAGLSADQIVECLEEKVLTGFMRRLILSGVAEEAMVEILETYAYKVGNGYTSNPRAKKPKQGPKERWGYDGPITPMLPEKDWWPLRSKILIRDQFVCKYCGIEGEGETQWCVDHVVPLSRGGTNDESNLVACCMPCNSSKSDRLLTEWRGRYQ